MTNTPLKAIKNEPNKPLLLYRKAIFFLENHAKRKGTIKNQCIRLPDVYHTLSTMFHLGKEDSNEVLQELKEAGLVEVVPYHGIRIVKKDLRAKARRI